MADAFFNNAESTFEGYDVTRDQIATLNNAVGGRIATNEAAKRLTAYPEAASSPVELTRRLSGIWTLLNDTAVLLPSAQEVVLSILYAIKELPRAKVPSGEGEEYMDIDDGHYWKEFTGWANNWADAFGSYAARFLIEPVASDHDGEERHTAWTNACTFTARLAATDDETLSSYGGGLDRASRAISEALESETGEKEPGSLEAAASLFKYAGRALYRRCKESQADGMLTGKAKLWNSGNGYSEARWRFWMDRWDVLSQQRGVSDRGHEIASEALQSMHETELLGSR